MFENVPSPSVSPNPVPPTPPPQPWAQPGGVPPAPQQSAPVAPPPQPVQDGKDWGPLKPIRKVPKPGEERMQSTLAVAAMPQVADVETKSKVGMILGLIGLLVVIGGGTAAFVFFGKKTDDTKLNGNANSVAVVTNANTNRSVFPAGNSNVNQAGNQNVNAASNVNSTGNVNAAGNVNQASGNTNASSNTNSNLIAPSPDADKDGIPDKYEMYFGTDSSLADSDGDSYSDIQEIAKGYSPNGTGSIALADFTSFCTKWVAGEDAFEDWSQAQRNDFCKQEEAIIPALLTLQKNNDVIKLNEAIDSQTESVGHWCDATFPENTNTNIADFNIKLVGCTLESFLVPFVFTMPIQAFEVSS